MGDLCDGVREEIERLRVDAPGLVAAALAMAASLDRKPSALMFGQLLAALDRLRQLAPEPESDDEVDELKAKRDRRLAG